MAYLKLQIELSTDDSSQYTDTYDLLSLVAYGDIHADEVNIDIRCLNLDQVKAVATDRQRSQLDRLLEDATQELTTRLHTFLRDKGDIDYSLEWYGRAKESWLKEASIDAILEYSEEYVINPELVYIFHYYPVVVNIPLGTLEIEF